MSRLQPTDLIKTAKKLVPTKGKPRQSDLLRASSTVYYAIFHTLASNCANTLMGGRASDRSKPAWRQVYRAIEHGFTKNACKKRTTIERFPVEIQDFANSFTTMQEKRHSADYDPHFTVDKTTVEIDIASTERVIANFQNCPLKDRRAFAAYILFKDRG